MSPWTLSTFSTWAQHLLPLLLQKSLTSKPSVWPNMVTAPNSPQSSLSDHIEMSVRCFSGWTSKASHPSLGKSLHPHAGLGTLYPHQPFLPSACSSLCSVTVASHRAASMLSLKALFCSSLCIECPLCPSLTSGRCQSLVTSSVRPWHSI